ncbi:solute carrier family 12 member 3-like [Nothobranchius furzeri]|uniref:solute carrier family 12 member 3-like n=1 Tax=Nothobranchius furzeri TaxID=105023 RepID=UPI00390466BC
MRDDADIHRQCCKLYAQANTIAPQLWSSYNQSSMNKLQVAYSDALRIILKIPRGGSASQISRGELRKTFVYNTMDQFPQLQNYATSMPRQVTKRRPSLGTLRKTFEAKAVQAEREAISNSSNLPEPDIENEAPAPKDEAPPRFGWIEGVMIRCMLNIWGVILFLRLTWITSQAGIVLTCLIILMSVVVTVVTALSISAIATNGSVASGGTYFLVSRTMGPEIGGPIGVVFSFANALASVLNIVGFAEVISQLLQEFNVVMVDPTNDVRIVGVITVTAILLIILAGMTWVMKQDQNRNKILIRGHENIVCY